MNTYHPYTIFPLGDSALTMEFGNLIDDEVNRKILSLFKSLQEHKPPFITDIIPAYSSLTLFYDPATFPKEKDKSAFETLAEMVEAFTAQESALKPLEEKLIKLPVFYDPSVAPDLLDMARQKKMAVEEIIRIHTGISYRVFMIGFLPGFAYMGEVDERLATPRHAEPRLIVAPGSVGIAGRQTGIYPLQSPGGWQIIGRTPIKLFNREEDMPVIFHPGDRVQFYSISANEFADYQSRNT